MQADFNFFDIARAYAVAPKIFLAWLRFEGEKWESDPYVGNGPGADEN